MSHDPSSKKESETKPEVYYIEFKEDKDTPSDKKENSRYRKIRELKGSIGPKVQEFIQGFKIGAMMGSAFGLVWGAAYGFKHKNYMMIPISMASSAFFFGGIVSFGSLIRGAEIVPIDFTEEDREFWRNKLELQGSLSK